MTGSSWNNWSCVAAQTSPPCKRTMLKATKIESLPEDIIIEILVRVPAQDIYDSRLVCRNWYKMIRTRKFVHSHFQRSTTPVLLGLCSLTLMTMQNDQIDISKMSNGFEGTVLSSCNGLVLSSRNGLVLGSYENLKEPYITNPITKQHLALPPVVMTDNRFSRFAIAYAASSKAYKVVHISDFNDDGNLECAIMTVGVDTDWGRRVSTQHLSLEAKELLKVRPLTTQGFVHWARNSYYNCYLNIYSEFVLTMNVESEIINQTPSPCLWLYRKSLCFCSYLPMGSYLSLLIDSSKYTFEAWKMKPETGEWTKLISIDLEEGKIYRHLCFGSELFKTSKRWLKPVGWSNSQEVLFFGVDYSIPNIPYPIYAAYNVRTREIGSYEIYPVSKVFVNHRSSLLWLD